MDARLLLDLGREVTGTLDLQEVLERSLAGLRHLAPLDGGLIYLVEDGVLCPAAAVPPLDPELADVRLTVGEGVTGSVAGDGVPIYVPDVTDDRRVGPHGGLRIQHRGTRSYFAAPLIMSGRPLGAVGVESREPDAFDADMRDALLAFVPTIAAAVVQARVFGLQETALERARMANDAIFQGLAVAKYALDSGQDDEAREAIAESLRRSRAVITDLLGEEDPPPGGLRRAG